MTLAVAREHLPLQLLTMLLQQRGFGNERAQGVVFVVDILCSEDQEVETCLCILSRFLVVTCTNGHIIGHYNVI